MLLNAGECSIQDLPVHTIHEVTKRLDLYSQRNLFLCSPHFYRMWQLHIAKDDKTWHDMHDCINLIETSLQAGACDKALLTIYGLSRAPAAIIVFHPSSTKSTFMISSVQTKSTEMTKDQFWHHLIGLPNLRDVNLQLISKMGARHDGLKAFAKQIIWVENKRKRTQ